MKRTLAAYLALLALAVSPPPLAAIMAAAFFAATLAAR